MEFEHLSSTTNSGWGSSTRWSRSCNSHGSGWKDFHHKFWDYWEFFREFFPHQRWKWNSNRIRNIESIGIDKRISKSRTWRSQLFILRGILKYLKIIFLKKKKKIITIFNFFFFQNSKENDDENLRFSVYQLLAILLVFCLLLFALNVMWNNFYTTLFISLVSFPILRWFGKIWKRKKLYFRSILHKKRHWTCDKYKMSVLFKS